MHRFSTLVLAALALAAAAAAPAGAQAPSLDDFKLRQTGLDLQARVDALAGQLVKSEVGPLLDDANRVAVEGGSCKDDAFPGIPRGSQWPGQNRPWTVTEHAGRRMLRRPAVAVRAQARARSGAGAASADRPATRSASGESSPPGACAERRKSGRASSCA